MLRRQCVRRVGRPQLRQLRARLHEGVSPQGPGLLPRSRLRKSFDQPEKLRRLRPLLPAELRVPARPRREGHLHELRLGAQPSATPGDVSLRR